MIEMFKAHFLQKSWHSLSMKCDVPLDELEKAAQAPKKTNVELQKDMVQQHWKLYTSVMPFGMSVMPGRR